MDKRGKIMAKYRPFGCSHGIWEATAVMIIEAIFDSDRIHYGSIYKL
jgi:hypothetical protein